RRCGARRYRASPRVRHPLVGRLAVAREAHERERHIPAKRLLAAFVLHGIVVHLAPVAGELDRRTALRREDPAQLPRLLAVPVAAVAEHTLPLDLVAERESSLAELHIALGLRAGPGSRAEDGGVRGGLGERGVRDCRVEIPGQRDLPSGELVGETLEIRI